jgi:hypothetical protein
MTKRRYLIARAIASHAIIAHVVRRGNRATPESDRA